MLLVIGFRVWVQGLGLGFKVSGFWGWGFGIWEFSLEDCLQVAVQFFFNLRMHSHTYELDLNINEGDCLQNSL